MQMSHLSMSIGTAALLSPHQLDQIFSKKVLETIKMGLIKRDSIIDRVMCWWKETSRRSSIHRSQCVRTHILSQKTEVGPWSFASPWTCYLFNLQLLHYKPNHTSCIKWLVSATLYQGLKKPHCELQSWDNDTSMQHMTAIYKSWFKRDWFEVLVYKGSSSFKDKISFLIHCGSPQSCRIKNGQESLYTAEWAAVSRLIWGFAS